MKSKYIMLLLASIIYISLISCSGGSHSKTENKVNSIMVFSAASLTDVLNEIVDSFEVKYHVKVKTNMASSGTLARQIEQGGKPDIYISASNKWANYIDSLGYIQQGFKSTIAKNQLVLITPKNSSIKAFAIDSTLDFISLLGKERLSIGDPAHVPAGRYAKQSLDYYGWYTKLNGKILPAKDVRSALMVVEMEEAPMGIVYKTDALKSSKVKILNTFPENSHKPIMYVSGVINNNQIAKDFYKYLLADETKVIWEKYGFN
ncbi:molybdate ABC transporter substrate-binding protein [Plebeiibacterium sediminum]|uniref:Molybdate ABC transporter substrate-binding protein n=1 Tax=Plebeiibacterium sediminum TaxID=2992112 RepID=A0AAE3M5V1_9BACT|nr:molybdate ABC transporter substrate-binding protein [Plebeiobacterium sediminum]MCW3787419.1 molybdate ABC transporter substrate-binding protein [Plebeiobacterium sediminum]